MTRFSGARPNRLLESILKNRFILTRHPGDWVSMITGIFVLKYNRKIDTLKYNTIMGIKNGIRVSIDINILRKVWQNTTDYRLYRCSPRVLRFSRQTIISIEVDLKQNPI